MLHYIIQTIAFQLFFLIIFDVFLKKETFFNWNRVYLLVTALLSLIIPFIKIGSFKDIISQDYIISLPEIIIGASGQQELNSVELSPILLSNNSFSILEFIFYVGFGIATLLFAFKLIKLLTILYKNPKQRLDNMFIISLLKSNKAFSFFNYIFLGDILKNDDRSAVLKHEMVHVKQRHTLDLLFFEFLRIIFWFNPLIYMYQNRIMSLHEFIADDQAMKNQSKKQYYQSLLSQVFETENMSFINPFFKQSLIKKRIVMLQKSKSKQVKLVKYALIIPLVFGMLIYTSCEKDTSAEAGKTLSSTDQIDELKLKLSVQAKEIIIEEEKMTILNSSEIIGVQTTKVSQNKDLKDYTNSLDVPFGVINQVPVFPGCEGGSAIEQRQCMSKKIAQHVNKNFNTDLASNLNLTGRQRINTMFKIDANGHVVDVRSRAPHPDLKAEAIRVIKTLPKFAPGEQNGKKVNVLYSLPIIFQVQD